MTDARSRSIARGTSPRFSALSIQAGSLATSVILCPMSYQGARSRSSVATNRLIRSRCSRLYAHSSPCLVSTRSHRAVVGRQHLWPDRRIARADADAAAGAADQTPFRVGPAPGARRPGRALL
ncbi:hypothetical protein [Streptomyces guryensis]|uniref:hypothetical protein n=1 Tax=Streptomyces guryensis TaxID=2886947 RepID=UPI00355780BD